MRGIPVLFGALFLLGLAGVSAAEPSVLWQKPVGAWTCGPCSIYNAFQFGAAPLPALGASLPGATPEARVTALIAKYGTRPSIPFARKRARYLDGKGTPPDDETAMLNDVLRDLGAPGAPARGDYLDLRPGESGPQQLARVRGLFARSLAVGLPPILELVSYAAQPSDKSQDGFVWNFLDGHYVVVAGVGDLVEGAPGFSLRLADSYTGRIQQAFVVAEVNRPFGASRGYVLQPDGTQKPIWIKGYPYLQLIAPGLPLATQKADWHTRTDIVLRYLTYRE